LWYSFVAVFVGAGLGALLRWHLGMALNTWFPNVPLGTLAANLIGGYCVGIAVVVFTAKTALPPEWRLFVITGLMGGLTTFSTYSVEVVTHLLAGRLSWALILASVHLVGSWTLTLLGIWTARVWLAIA